MILPYFLTLKLLQRYNENVEFNSRQINKSMKSITSDISIQTHIAAVFDRKHITSYLR